MALLTGLPALMAALAAFIQSILNGQKAHAQTFEIKELHILVNDRLTQLLARTEQAAHLQGVLQERARDGGPPMPALPANCPFVPPPANGTP